MKKIAVFASGRGSNAQKIITHFNQQAKATAKVVLIVSNKKQAPVLDLGRKYSISTLVLQRKTFYETEQLLQELTLFEIDFIALAGFLWFVPDYLTQAYRQRMVNIHPSLLPKYGGKGMYGSKVHEAVHANSDTETGMTIHYVNEAYDEGQIIFQARCAIEQQDTPTTIAKKVQRLEHEHFPKVIEQLLNS